MNRQRIFHEGLAINSNLSESCVRLDERRALSIAITNRDLPAGTRLVADYKKTRCVCAVEAAEEGESVNYALEDGKKFKSPSAAGSIDDPKWHRVDQIIRDPERVRRKCTGRHYELASRIRCGLCGAAMVGQTLTTKGKPYSYYRCRHAYDKNAGRDCSARYVQAQGLEDAVWGEVRRILPAPL